MHRRFASFMHSHPNAIPLARDALATLRAHVDPLDCVDLHGSFEGKRMIGDAKARVEASFARYRRR